MADPLQLLRAAVMSKSLSSVVRDNSGHIVFRNDGTSFPKDELTAYKSQAGKGAFYSLEAMLLFVNASELNQPPMKDYMKTATSAMIQPVSFVDRKDLLAYLRGEIDQSDCIELVAPPVRRGTEVAAKRPREGDEADGEGAAADQEAPRLIVSRKRAILDRNSGLMSPGKSFEKVFGVLADAQKSLQRDARAGPRPVVQAPRGGRYEDKRQADVWKEHLGGTGLEDLGIDANASFIEAPKQQQPQAQARAQQAPPQRAPQAAPQADARRGGAAAAGPSKPVAGKEKDASGLVPIILVPSGYGAGVLLNMFNAADFIIKGEFKTWQDAKKAGATKQGAVTVERTFRREKPVKYVITDVTPDRRSKDWERVVAVFVMGQFWQFKDWPHEGIKKESLVEALSRVRGFFLRYTTDPPNQTVKTWNVKTLSISRDARYGDKAQQEAFWTELDTFLSRTKSQLAY